MKKIRIVLYFLFLCLTTFAQREIPHEIITKNPNRSVKEIKTLKRRQEDAKLTIRVKKIKTTEIPVEIDEVRKLIYFNINDNLAEDKILFLGDKEISWVNNGTFKRQMINKVRNNYGQNFEILNWNSLDGKRKVSYKKLGSQLYIAVLDDNYEIKKIYNSKFIRKNVQKSKRSDVKIWLFAKDLDKISNLIITPSNNIKGNFMVRANSENNPPEHSQEKTNTYSTFDLSGGFLNNDFDDSDKIRVEVEKNTTIIEQNQGSFYSNRNKYATVNILGHTAKVRVWSEYEGVELSLEKNNGSDGVAKFKLIHETADGIMLQEINFEIYINNNEVDNYFIIKKNSKEYSHTPGSLDKYKSIDTDIFIKDFISDEIQIEQLSNFDVERRFGETGETSIFKENEKEMKYMGRGNLEAKSEGKINYEFDRIELFIHSNWYKKSRQTAQFFTGYGLNVTYGKRKRKVNIPARVGIYSNWQESTEKIISKILGLPLLNKSLNKDNINGIQTIEFLTAHFEHIVVKHDSSKKVTVEVNGEEKYTGKTFNEVSVDADGIGYSFKNPYSSGDYQHYSIHINKMSLENYDREQVIKASTYLGSGKIVSKQNIIKIPKFDPGILINKYNSSIERDIFRYEEISNDLINNNKGKIISLGRVFFYQLNTEILQQNSSTNPKIYLGNNYQLEAQSSTIYKTIDVELSFDKNGKKDFVEMDIKSMQSNGEGGELFLKITPEEYEKFIKNGGNITYKLKSRNNIICNAYFKKDKNPTGNSSSTIEFDSPLINSVTIQTKTVDSSLGQIEFLVDKPLLKGGKIAIKNSSISYVEQPISDYDYNNTVILKGNVDLYDYTQRKHDVEIVDGDGRQIRKIIGSNGSAGYWENISLGDGNVIDIGYNKNDNRTFLALRKWDFKASEGTITIKHYAGSGDSIYQYYIFQFKLPDFNPLIYYDEYKTSDTIKSESDLNVKAEENDEIYIGDINLKNYDWEITKTNDGILKDEIGLRIEGNKHIKIKGNSGRIYQGEIIIKNSTKQEIDYYNDKTDTGKVYLKFKENKPNEDCIVNLMDNNYILQIGRNNYFKNIIKSIKLESKSSLEGSSTINITGEYISGNKIRFNSTTMDKKNIQTELIVKPRGINLTDVTGSAPIKMENSDIVKVSVGNKIILNETIDSNGNLEERMLSSVDGNMYFSINNGNIELKFKKNHTFIQKDITLDINVERNGSNVMKYTLKVVNEPSWLIIDAKKDIDFGKVFAGYKNIKGNGFIKFRTSPDVDKNNIQVTLDNKNPKLYKESKYLESEIDNIILKEEEKNNYQVDIIGNLDIPKDAEYGEYVGQIEVKIQVIE